MLKKIAVLFVIFSVYSSFFILDKTLSSGDWPYVYLENIKEFSFLPDSGFFWLVPYYQGSAKILVEYIGINWHFAEKILWFWPFLGLSIFSSFYLTRSWIGVLIFTASTYPLMLVGGGQMGVAVAYSLAPLVLATFIKLIDNFVLLTQNFKFQISNFKFPIGIGLVLAVQVMFDPRITYVTFMVIFIYLFFAFIFSPNKKKFVAKSFFLIIPVFTAVALNSFWIISLLKYGLPPQDIAKMSTLGFRFLSFADFPHAFSALHPNWPENIFGKVYFMRSEFIFLPVLAYSSLLFFRNKAQKNAKPYTRLQSPNGEAIGGQAEQRRILFFALLGLIGAFLAKGSNPPFGFINEFLFQYFPAMSMFRDSTKFYLMVLLSYSALIPFSICSIQDWLNSKFKNQKSKPQFKIQNYLPSLFLILTISYLIFLIRPALFGQLGGTFKPRDVPQEYVKFKDFIQSQPGSFKTLWMPQVQRFGFRTSLHPALEANQLYGTESGSLDSKRIKADSIKYIIIPLDSEKEIFLEDRKYNESIRNDLIEKLNRLDWLQKIPKFGDLAVFEVK